MSGIAEAIAERMAELRQQRQRTEERISFDNGQLSTIVGKLDELQWVLDTLGSCSAAPGAEPAEPAPKRRYVRGQVLQAIRAAGALGIEVAEVAEHLKVEPAQVELAVTWYSDPKRKEIALRNGLWYATEQLPQEPPVAEPQAPEPSRLFG